MAHPSTDGDYVFVNDGTTTIWWRQDQPSEIHMTVNDPDFHHPNTGPGLHVVFSSVVDSANYHPANFNRCARVLKKHGKAHPPEVAEGERRLDRRGWRKVQKKDGQAA